MSDNTPPTTVDQLRVSMNVEVDGMPGFISKICPTGNAMYKGKCHAYVWVRIPSQDYCDIWSGERVLAGMAVPFTNIQRLKVIA